MVCLRFYGCAAPDIISTHPTFLFFYTQFISRGVLEKRQENLFPFLTSIGPVFGITAYITPKICRLYKVFTQENKQKCRGFGPGCT